MSRPAGPLLGVGRLRLTGKGAERSALPRGTATDVGGERLDRHHRRQPNSAGRPLSEPDRLADFRLPQRGICVIGSARFDTFDPARHLPGTRTAPTRPRTSC